MKYKWEKEIYILLADGDGTTRSIDTPFGVAVTSEEDAKRFCKESNIGYSRSYTKITVFDSLNDGLNWWLDKIGQKKFKK